MILILLNISFFFFHRQSFQWKAIWLFQLKKPIIVIFLWKITKTMIFAIKKPACLWINFSFTYVNCKILTSLPIFDLHEELLVIYKSKMSLPQKSCQFEFIARFEKLLQRILLLKKVQFEKADISGTADCLSNCLQQISSRWTHYAFYLKISEMITFHLRKFKQYLGYF